MARLAVGVAAALLLTASASAGTTTITITSSPPRETSSTSATFEFTVEPKQTVYCYLDGAQNPAGPCSSPQTYTGLEVTKHLFRVEESSIDDVPAPAFATWDWVVVAPGPDTVITSGPTGTVSARSATFTFRSDQDGASFECSLDDAPFESCDPGKTYPDLALGRHHFAVRALTDSATDDTPATSDWTISATPQPPDTQLTSAPSGTVLSRAATFRFVSVPPGASFECSLDSAAFRACPSGQAYSGLTPGLHSFRVRAVLAGLVDPSPAYRQWTVSERASKPPDTVFIDVPDAKTSARQVTLAYESVPTGAGFQCSLDGEPFRACAATTVTPRLSVGTHHFRVQAVRAGAVDPTPAATTWRVVRGRSIVWPTVGGGLGAAALLAAGGGLVFHRRRLRTRLRLRPFELEASDEEPPRTCRVPGSHTWRRDCKLKPALRKIESLTLSAEGVDPHREQVTGDPVEQLNSAVRARRLRRRRRLEALVGPVADELFSHAERWAGDASVEIAVEAELTGGKLECEFRRYECVPRGDDFGWDEVEKWRGEAEHRTTLPVARLVWPVAHEIFTTALASALLELVQRVDVPRRQPAPEAPAVPDA